MNNVAFQLCFGTTSLLINYTLAFKKCEQIFEDNQQYKILNYAIS